MMTIPLILLAIPAAVIGFVGVRPKTDGFNVSSHQFLSKLRNRRAKPSKLRSTSSTHKKRTLPQQKVNTLRNMRFRPRRLFSVSSRPSSRSRASMSRISPTSLDGSTRSPSPTAIARSTSFSTTSGGLTSFTIVGSSSLRNRRSFPLARGRRSDHRRAVNGTATLINATSQRLRHVQTGLVANYALAIALGMVVIVGVYLTRSAVCSGSRF